jgi:hypothetical protein
MATHREEELLGASRTLGAIARSLGIAPRRVAPLAPEPEPAFAPVAAQDWGADAPSFEPPPPRGVFDFEAPEPVRRAA